MPQRKKTPNMKIQRIMNAAIGATLDRRIINKAAKEPVKAKHNSRYIAQLEKVSGPPAANFKQSLDSWRKAYLSNLERIKLIEDLNAPFKKKSTISDFVSAIFKK